MHFCHHAVRVDVDDKNGHPRPRIGFVGENALMYNLSFSAFLPNATLRVALVCLLGSCPNETDGYRCGCCVRVNESSLRLRIGRMHVSMGPWTVVV